MNKEDFQVGKFITFPMSGNSYELTAVDQEKRTATFADPRWPNEDHTTEDILTLMNCDVRLSL